MDENLIEKLHNYKTTMKRTKKRNDVQKIDEEVRNTNRQKLTEKNANKQWQQTNKY